MLGTAMAAVGLSTSRSDVSGVGMRPFMLGFGGCVIVGSVGFMAASILPYAMEMMGTPLPPSPRMGLDVLAALADDVAVVDEVVGSGDASAAAAAGSSIAAAAEQTGG